MSTFLNPSITSRAQFKQYILMSLGAPLVTVELTEDQLDLCINNALELYTKWVNLEQKYIVLNLTQYVTEVGLTLPNNVLSIFSIDGGKASVYSSDALFGNYTFMMTSGAFDFAFGNSAPYAFVNYEVALQHLKVAERMFGKGFDFHYDTYTKLLTLYPDPIKSNISGYVILGCYVEPAEAKLLSVDYIKQLALAESKVLLGTIRSKFTGVNLLGGGQINADIKAEGIAERDKLVEELRNKGTGPAGFFIG